MTPEKTRKKPSDYPSAAFRLTSEIEREMQPFLDRTDGHASSAAREFLNWSVAALQAGRAELQERFTVTEWRAIAAALSGTHLEPSLWPHLPDEIFEADEEIGLECDRPDIAVRVQELSPAGRWALCDCLMRVRADVNRETLREAGVKARLLNSQVNQKL